MARLVWTSFIRFRSDLAGVSMSNSEAVDNLIAIYHRSAYDLPAVSSWCQGFFVRKKQIFIDASYFIAFNLSYLDKSTP